MGQQTRVDNNLLIGNRVNHILVKVSQYQKQNRQLLVRASMIFPFTGIRRSVSQSQILGPVVYHIPPRNAGIVTAAQAHTVPVA